jgi:trans-L-3-hydroxyproline dehydratase
LIKIGQSRTFEGPTGAKFQAKPEKEIKYGDYNAVVVEVSGNGYYTGTSTFTFIYAPFFALFVKTCKHD